MGFLLNGEYDWDATVSRRASESPFVSRVRVICSCPDWLLYSAG